MSTRVPISIEGNLVADPDYGESQNGTKFAKFTVAVTDRKLEDGKWVDGDTQYYGVSCWRALAQNVATTAFKGMPVIIQGRLRTHQVERDGGQTVTYYDIDATAVGPDLNRGTAVFSRTKSDGVRAAEARALADAHVSAA